MSLLSFLFNIQECTDHGAICELSEEEQKQQQKRMDRLSQAFEWLYWFLI